MKSTAILRTLVALILFAGAGLTSARADEGFVTLTVYKAGWIIGGSGGGGVLTFRGRSYGLTTGGLDYGASCSVARKRSCADVSTISGGRPMSQASMARPARGLRWAAARVPSC